MSDDLTDRQRTMIAEIVRRCPDSTTTVTGAYLAALLRRDPAHVSADLAVLQRRRLLEPGSALGTYRPTGTARARYGT